MKDKKFAEKYLIESECKDEGGMGKVLIVRSSENGPLLALKYCKDSDDHMLQRFKREVATLIQYDGNSKVVQVLDSDLAHNPPYFVMPLAQVGNLLAIRESLIGKPAKQEEVFNRMVDCIAEVHGKGHVHRDIKPQNFLVYDAENIVVADFGLIKDPGSTTPLTVTAARAGTEDYAPPEFYLPGGFKTATVAWDIFTLGKSFYRLLTNRNARFLSEDGVEPALFFVIDKCCKQQPDERYQSLADLKQAMKAAFDILLKRVDGEALFQALMFSVEDMLKTEGRYLPAKVRELMKTLFGLEEAAQLRHARKFDANLIGLLVVDAGFSSELQRFLEVYGKMAESNSYSDEFAEKIANRMEIIFTSEARDEHKARALEIAIRAATKRDRFAAMANCVSMITNVVSDSLAVRVADVLRRNPSAFVRNIEPSSCRHRAVASIVDEIRKSPRK